MESKATERDTYRYRLVMTADIAAERRNRLLKMVERWGSIRASDAATALGVDLRTVQRDLDALARQELISRAHGGATSRAGRPPRSGRTRTPPLRLGLLLPTNNYYYSDIIDGVRDAAVELNCTVIDGAYHYVDDDQDELYRRILRLNLDGLLMTPSFKNPAWGRLLGSSIPTVVIERPRRPRWVRGLESHESLTALSSIDHVHSDHAYGAALALEHLFSLGHRSVHCLLQDTPTAFGLRTGIGDYAAVLEGQRWGTTHVHSIDSSSQDGKVTVEEVLGSADNLRDSKITAILAHPDAVAVEVDEHLGRLGLSVSEDVSLLSYDDALFSHVDTQISAMSPRRRWIGRRACELLVERLRSQGRATHRTQPASEISIAPHLVDRNTTGPPKRRGVP